MDKQNPNILIVTTTLNSIYIAPETINNITEEYQSTHSLVDECWTIIDIVSAFQNAHQSLFQIWDPCSSIWGVGLPWPGC